MYFFDYLILLDQPVSPGIEIQGWYLITDDKVPTVDHIRMHQVVTLKND
jgi:hypothetical protein